jgi:nucleoside-diphosphate-sugar epimerase
MSPSTRGEPLRLLVTGATGFIGSRLALVAHRIGIDVVAAGRLRTRQEIDRANELREAGVRVVFGTLDDADHLRFTVAGRNCVIHLAAAQHEAHLSARQFREVNVAGTRALIEAACAAGVERFIYGSSIGVYGVGADPVLDETSAVQPENIYTQTKLEAEIVVREFAHDLATCIVRIGETYGPSDYRLLKLFRAIDREQFIMIGSGQNRRQCLHVSDLVRFLLLATHHPNAVGETFVVSGSQAMTTNEMVRMIAAALQRRAPRRHVPLWPFTVAARVLETILPPLGVQPPLHRRRLDFFSKSFVFSTAKVQGRLGFKPEIDFVTGAANTAQWYREQGHLPVRVSHPVAESESA